MARLDLIIEKLLQSGAQDLIFETGSTGYFRVDQSKRPVYRENLSSDQILGLLSEIAPKGLWKGLEAIGAFRFVHRSPAGSVEVLVHRRGSEIRASLRPRQPDEVTVPPQRQEEPSEPTSPPRDPNTPTPQLLSHDPAQGMAQLLQLMVERRASDLHLVPYSPPILRIDGDLVPSDDLDVIEPERLEAMLWSITPRRNRDEWETIKDTDYAHETAEARFRVNVFANRHGIAAVFRQIPANILTAEQLNLPPALLELCFLTKGLVLVTGPTGSGKSTTLAALIDHINRHRSDHILTIEDPIEFVHKNQKCLVNQREVGVHTESFKRALRAALREDPDVILVGELRDLETIAIAIETAETGHLVFGTLHTSTAASTVDRIIDQFPADQQAQIRTMLSESLKGVISQTLCKKIGGGRAAALEILLVNHAISNLVREGKTYQIPSAMQTGKGQGMMTLNDALLDLVRREVIEPEEAFRKAIAKSEMRAALEREGHRVV